METGSPGKREARDRRLLDLVAELGNVTEACRRLGVDRSAYYRLRAASGGNPDGTPAPRRNAIAPGLAQAVLDLCLAFPEWGCDRLALYLTLKGRPLSSPTVQKILIRNGLGRSTQRMAERARLARQGEGKAD